MSGVSLRNVKKAYGTTPVIHGVDIEIDKGEFVVFVGPSNRGVAMVFQTYALYPHMSVD